MKLLIFTQTVDKNDSVLGFMHTWIKELSKKFESIEVICLGKGEYDLPRNVTVYSLGKEEGVSKIGYIINLYKYLHLISGSYDAVFVHMNQEYVLLAGLYWKIKGIPVYMWRNHKKGSFLTVISIKLCTKVFCVSKDSFTAKFKNAVIMPVGVDTENFKESDYPMRKKYSICMWGRISPVKNIEKALEAVKILVSLGVQVTLTIGGPVPEKDVNYMDGLKGYITRNNLSSVVQFVGPMSYEKIPEFANQHELYLNLTESGSFDKTIMEAVACGLVPIVSNTSLRGILPLICITENEPVVIAESIKVLLNPGERVKIQDDLRRSVESESLNVLMGRLSEEMK